MKTPLDKYVVDFPKVQIVRSPQRDGLIHARMRGAKVATGEFLLFLDSHCEAMEGNGERKRLGETYRDKGRESQVKIESRLV